MARVNVTRLKSVQELTNEDLRGEGEGWQDEGETVEAGTAVLVPDDGSGPLQGFYRADKGKGMVAWGDDDNPCDWIDCDSLEDLFRIYANTMM